MERRHIQNRSSKTLGQANGDGYTQTRGGGVYRRSEPRDPSSNGSLMRLTFRGKRIGRTARIALICVGTYRLHKQLKATQPRSSCIPLECPHLRQIIVVYLRSAISANRGLTSVNLRARANTPTEARLSGSFCTCVSSKEAPLGLTPPSTRSYLARA
jgi:hypothetical protein